MLRSWIAVALGALVSTAGAQTAPPRTGPFETAAEVRPRGKIDELVFARLRQLGIQPARNCSDGVFVRRAFLDVLGTLPTAQEASQFIFDKSPGKRRLLIDTLLERREFADYWAMKWCEIGRASCRERV